MTRTRTSAIPQQRQLLAEACARLIANDGMTDYAAVKRKAVRQLGCDDTRNLPTNEEVDEALRAYRKIYHSERHPQVLHALRIRARELMRQLAHFDPWLIGAVMDGSAGEYSDIELLVLSDDPKEVEFFLLNAGIDYRHVDCPLGDGVCMRWQDEAVAVLLTVLPQKRARYKSQQERVHLDGLEQLLAADPAQPL